MAFQDIKERLDGVLGLRYHSNSLEEFYPFISDVLYGCPTPSELDYAHDLQHESLDHVTISPTDELSCFGFEWLYSSEEAEEPAQEKKEEAPLDTPAASLPAHTKEISPLHLVATQGKKRKPRLSRVEQLKKEAAEATASIERSNKYHASVMRELDEIRSKAGKFNKA